MKEKIYGYQIQQPPAEGIYEAISPAGEPVILYEWTPPAGKMDAAKHRLATVVDETSCDAFTADGNFYLVANSAQEGENWLEFLRSRDLFTDRHETEASEEPQPPVVETYELPDTPDYDSPPELIPSRFIPVQLIPLESPPPTLAPLASPQPPAAPSYDPRGYVTPPEIIPPPLVDLPPPPQKKKMGCAGCLGIIFVFFLIFLVLRVLIWLF